MNVCRFPARALGFSLLAISLVSCLSKEEKASESSSSESSSIVAQSVSTLDSLAKCNNGKEGSLVYVREQSSFFTCENGNWVAIDIRGPKGDPGAAGASGPQGPAGANGTNGRDGIDGGGARLVLRENGAVKAQLIQYTLESAQHALVMLPTRELIFIDPTTGLFEGRPVVVYYTEQNCTGTAYTGRDDYRGPHVLDRIYVGEDNDYNAIAYYKAVETGTFHISYRSYRQYNTVGQMHYCKNMEGISKLSVRVINVPPPSSLSHLAPIRFEF